jgi:protein JSN1
MPQQVSNLGPILNNNGLASGVLSSVATGATRPNLRHATTAAAALSGERAAHSRLRSGSLTLPPSAGPIASSANNSNAFGSSLFPSSWLNPQSASGYPILDEHRSMTSSDSLTGDDVHTLDYLGLDDRSRAPQPATVTELRSQAQAAIAGRLRATTVSHPYRNRPLQGLGTPQGQEDLEELDEYDSPSNYRPVDSFNGAGGGMYYNSDQAPFIARGFKQSQHLGVSVRTRATSVGALEDPSRLRQNAIYADINQGIQLNQPPSAAANAIMRGLVDNKTQLQQSRLAQQMPAGRYTGGDISHPGGNAGFLQPPPGQPRSVSPKSEPQVQTPSRSLWIGNLDTTATKETLLTVFSPYGAIESLRLLPEKECGFVNFLDINDAIRAKDDVLNRLGGNIGLQNGQLVRVGFGKADSAPAQPAKANGPVNVNANVLASTAGAPAGMEVQSTPTRALWIGSIPSTTTPATILSIFAPFGPIESARVLTHKNCGFGM